MEWPFDDIQSFFHIEVYPDGDLFNPITDRYLPSVQHSILTLVPVSNASVPNHSHKPGGASDGGSPSASSRRSQDYQYRNSEDTNQGDKFDS